MPVYGFQHALILRILAGPNRIGSHGATDGQHCLFLIALSASSRDRPANHHIDRLFWCYGIIARVATQQRINACSSRLLCQIEGANAFACQGPVHVAAVPRLRRYAEAHADAWFILSAEHGLVHPDEVLAPYERTLNHISAADRRSWVERVQAQLTVRVPAGADIIVLAGQRYREDLVPFLRDRGHSVSVPFEGMPFGRQLQRLTEMFGVSNRRYGMRQSRLAQLTSRSAVLEAIDEFDRLGREAFLKKYGYGVGAGPPGLLNAIICAGIVA